MSGGGASLSLGLLGTGRMGRMVEEVALGRGHRIGLRLDAASNRDAAGMSARALSGIDVLIDFSAAAAVMDNLRAAAREGCSIVVGTTGWDRDPEARRQAEALVREGGIGAVVAPNFSFGMHRFRRLVEEAARLAGADAETDLWIEEAHHRGKADHPSGTALALARSVLEAMARKERIETRLPEGPVDPAALQVTASRGGWVPGQHRVVLDAPHETIELVHTARSREVFAQGAVRSAEWLHGRSGYFTLDDVLGETPGKGRDA